MNIKCAIFDLDGVIVDTAKYHYLAWKKLAEELNIPFTEKENELFKGVSRMRCMEILMELGNIQLSQEEQVKLATKKNEWYVDYISVMTDDELLPGAKEFLIACKDVGIKTALGSASKNAPRILKALAIEDLFDAVIDGNKVSKAKPDPEVFIKGAEECGIPAENCVVFEDAYAGIEAAHAGNMLGIGVGTKENLPIADVIIAGLHELTVEGMKEILNDK
ncbi:beta-phosphoglucomutase [Vallitalea okinawensis]|uniref:beta-phosphoglucomutase n=1 Tax=Vallitalea okinawensis TaxID=2078660 RepID=UPI000CFD647B|nr:beta-phosphoglucomutase [Vallitalea okinawensis]